MAVRKGFLTAHRHPFFDIVIDAPLHQALYICARRRKLHEVATISGRDWSQRVETLRDFDRGMGSRLTWIRRGGPATNRYESGNPPSILSPLGRGQNHRMGHRAVVDWREHIPAAEAAGHPPRRFCSPGALPKVLSLAKGAPGAKPFCPALRDRDQRSRPPDRWATRRADEGVCRAQRISGGED